MMYDLEKKKPKQKACGMSILRNSTCGQDIRIPIQIRDQFCGTSRPAHYISQPCLVNDQDYKVFQRIAF